MVINMFVHAQLFEPKKPAKDASLSALYVNLAYLMLLTTLLLTSGRWVRRAVNTSW